MSHVIHDFAQGSDPWHAHRAKHFNASQASAMLGISPYQTRTDLLTSMALGTAIEVSAGQQAIFDNGHRYEMQARPWAEGLLGSELYPIVASREVEGLPLSASYDGVTMNEDAVFEHKTLNNGLGESLDRGEIPEHYRAQLEQQLLIIGAERALFMASNGDEKTMRHEWYESDPAMRARLIAGWKQFAEDLKNYQHADAKVQPAAAPVLDLPAVSVQVSGALTITDNFKAFEIALRDFIDTRLIRTPQTDQDFADLDEQIKTLKKAEAALDAAEAQMLAQVSAVDVAKRAKDMLHRLTRDNRLMAEKLLTAEKDRRRAEILKGGQDALKKHIDSLNASIGMSYMPAIPADFAGAIRGLRTIKSLEDAVATTLANAKIAANEEAEKIRANLAHLRAQHEAYGNLFPDEAQLVLKPADHFQLAVKSRIDDHEKRLDAERQRIRQEEEARAQARQQAQTAPVPQPQPTSPDTGTPLPETSTTAGVRAPLTAEEVADLGAREALEAWVNAYGKLPTWAPLAATIRSFLNAGGKKRRAA